MIVDLSRALVALASLSMPAHRRHWGEAMEAELEAAVDDGRPLAFALGCLAAAWRALPGFPQGRHCLASHAVAIGLVLPLAVWSLWTGLLGYPYLGFGRAGIAGFLAGRSEQVPLLVDGEWSMAPALTLLVFALAAGQALLAWFLLERDWDRVAAIVRFNAATLTTLLIACALLAIADAALLLPVAVLAGETLVVLALEQWHRRLGEGETLVRVFG